MEHKPVRPLLSAYKEIRNVTVSGGRNGIGPHTVWFFSEQETTRLACRLASFTGGSGVTVLLGFASDIVQGQGVVWRIVQYGQNLRVHFFNDSRNDTTKGGIALLNGSGTGLQKVKRPLAGVGILTVFKNSMSAIF